MKLTGITPKALIQGTLNDAKSALDSVRQHGGHELAAADIAKLPKPLQEAAKSALGTNAKVSTESVISAFEKSLEQKLAKSIGAGAILSEEVDQSLFDMMSHSRVGMQLEQALLAASGSLTPEAADAMAKRALKSASASAKGQADLFRTLKKAADAHAEADPFSETSKALKDELKARGDALKGAVDEAVTAAAAELKAGRDPDTVETLRLALTAAIEIYQAVAPKSSRLVEMRNDLKQLGAPETKEPEPFFAKFLESQDAGDKKYPVAGDNGTFVTMKFPSDVEDAGPEGAVNQNPTTLGEYLAFKKISADKLFESDYALSDAARTLLKAQGIESPTESQVKETQSQIADAVESGDYKDFRSTMKADMIALADGVEQREGNVFYEKEWFAPSRLTVDKLKLAPEEMKKLNGDFESGRAGMVLAATFVNSSQRAEGDFSRAYGDEAWRGFMRANTYLNKIPKGEFLEKLNLDVVLETNRIIHAPDNYLMGQILRGIAMIGRGLRWDKGGELRQGRQFARPERYNKEEIAALKQAGVKVTVTGVHSNGERSAMLEYPPASEVKPKLEELLRWVRSESRKEGMDPVAIAAEFQRRFVAIHPFGDSNGRTSRLLMNRILAEFDLPPAILKDQNRDISVPAELFRDKVAQGIARSRKFLTSARLESKAGYADKLGVKLLEKSPDRPVNIDGSPFDLGQDGFLYDPAGRPWLAFGDELVPLSQLEHYTIIRRVSQMDSEAGVDALTRLTKKTRDLYANVSDDPALGEKLKVRPDRAVRDADIDYRMAPSREVAELLVELSDVKKIDKTRLFAIKGARGTDATSTISKHSQVDLELWYVEAGLKEQGFDDLANKVRKQRADLFAAARGHLQTLVAEERISPENPMGFAFKYEQMMYDNSPLRFESLKDAIAADGDRTITVWRGDYGFARLLGMAPNNDIRQPDAKAVAEDRAKSDTITNLYDDLMKLEGSAMGRQYISTTSDLGLLTQSFATKVAKQKVNIGSIPDIIADKILAWAADKREGESDVQKREKRTELNKERESKGLDPLPADGGRELRDSFGIPGSILQVRAASGGKKELEVTASRKAFLLRLDKTAVLPGIVALGGHSFESEQELHGLERVFPWQVKGVFDAKKLKDELPVTDEALAAKKKADAEKKKETEAAAKQWKAHQKATGAAGGAPTSGAAADFKKGDSDFKKTSFDVKEGSVDGEHGEVDAPFVPLEYKNGGYVKSGDADFEKGNVGPANSEPSAHLSETDPIPSGGGAGFQANGDVDWKK